MNEWGSYFLSGGVNLPRLCIENQSYLNLFMMMSNMLVIRILCVGSDGEDLPFIPLNDSGFSFQG